MKTTPKFKKRFRRISNSYMKAILKTRKLKKIKDFAVKAVEPDINCYKNFVMNSFALYDVHNLNLKLYYSMLPSALLKNHQLINQTLLELNQDGYIYLRRNFLRYFIVDNQKTWIDLPCGSIPNKDLTNLMKYDTSLTPPIDPQQLLEDEDESTLFLLNDEPIEDPTVQFSDPPVQTERLTIAQIEALEKMDIIVNLLANVFVRLCFQNEKLTSDQKAILEEITLYNDWVIKAKQQQFEKQNPASAKNKKATLSETAQEALRADVQNSLVDPEARLSRNNYFDQALNKVISKESKKTFAQLGWKKARVLIINDYPDLFGFLGQPPTPKSKTKKRLKKADPATPKPTKQAKPSRKTKKPKEGK